MDKLFVSALSASVIASLLFVSGTERFQFLSERVGTFSGMSVGGVAAVLWSVYGLRARKRTGGDR